MSRGLITNENESQHCQADLGNGFHVSPFQLEIQAYNDSVSRVSRCFRAESRIVEHSLTFVLVPSIKEEYDAAIHTLARPSRPSETCASQWFDLSTNEGDDSGIRIGSYQDCHYVASGVTAEVYRCEARALKVITETHAIEPHNPRREATILTTFDGPAIIQLLETFRDQEQRLVLVFPYMPLTLASVLDRGEALSEARVRSYFNDIFAALKYIHGHGIIHRDIKPSAVLLESSDGPAYLSDFGTAWHPLLSANTEPADNKILDVGTGPYRAPEALFGNKSYGTALDMWGAGAMFAEACRNPPKPLFESRGAHEDGNQLGLILSIFKTIGTPTLETWPEAATFKTPPFEMYQVFEGKPWEFVLPDVQPDFRGLVAKLVTYSGRATADEALLYLNEHPSHDTRDNPQLRWGNFMHGIQELATKSKDLEENQVDNSQSQDATVQGV
ncbi:uncharacterized protein E0L32_000310 [Thyridium curvatum]|uniref:cyclin-dependent kinase n=1 Tax=Thyridium curvatum TaxID=1093900 RepID=A0A507B9W1_9PEZI|nr:uncharacterized protein E0L32_000310 [Thyridium curvatum]TPX15976.1 hypothetical protein E0L32_000310 [Thyridium curvatum]